MAHEEQMELLTHCFNTIVFYQLLTAGDRWRTAGDRTSRDTPLLLAGRSTDTVLVSGVLDQCRMKLLLIIPTTDGCWLNSESRYRPACCSLTVTLVVGVILNR